MEIVLRVAGNYRRVEMIVVGMDVPTQCHARSTDTLAKTTKGKNDKFFPFVG